MGKYKRPKSRLHHEFLYLNHDTILNALSALEAGAVDAIIEKTNEAREGGIEAGAAVGPVRGGAGKKRQTSIQEELVRTRTWFSAFDAWQRALEEGEALGSFDEWDLSVRNEMAVGDTVRFEADISLSPVHKILATFMAYAAVAGTSASPFQLTNKEVQDAKRTAQQMGSWLSGPNGRRNLPVYLAPGGMQSPRMVARLDEKYIIGGLDSVEGRFTVVGQVDSLLNGQQKESVIRILRDVPPTPKEVETSTDALRHFIEPSRELGVEYGEGDLIFEAPAVIMRPIAIYK